jgi:hypothetical protein
MKFLVLLLLIYNQRNIKNNSGLFLNNSKSSNTFKNKISDEKYNGFDHRIINETKEKHEKHEKELNLYKIAKYFEKKKILDILENKNVSLTTKLLLLQDNRIKTSNIFEGGLMRDFDFEF